MPQTGRSTGSRRSAAMYRSVYVDGSAARKLKPAPYEIEEERRQRREARQHEQERIRRHNQRIARENREKVLKMDLKYTLFLGVAVIATLLVCVYYLGLQSRMTAQSKQISLLKSELTALVDENLATQERINNAVDLEEVIEAATQMGMNYAAKSQIIYYSGSSDDYVKQYREIPQAK